MNSIERWLAQIGLNQYSDLFAENALDEEVLPYLTDADLKELGLPLGHRRKILAAIAALRSEAGADTRAPASTDDRSSSQAPETLEAERRQLTVMFCDLVGSTELAQRLDPEDLRIVISTSQEAWKGAIERYGGYIARYMGDGVLAYFGYPRAHEDDAERSVRAALAVAEAMSGVNASTSQSWDADLCVRIGIATGLVVVGDLTGEGAAQESAVLGETPNLAARLQGLAKPGQIVIAESTRRLLGEVFQLEPLGPQMLKGIVKPVASYAVHHERETESRFQAHHVGRLLPLRGRQQELALLVSRWHQARAGEGQCVLMTGEAGIGKSRLAQALIDALGDETHIRLRYQCSPHHRDSAFYPVIQQLTRAADFRTDDSNLVKLEKIENLLEQAGSDIAEVAPLIAALLGVDGEARYGKLELTPQQLRSRTLDTLIAQLEGLARRQPVLFLLEDAHWIDPSTLELVELTLERTAATPVLLLLTARPTFESDLGVHSNVTQFTLNRLGREHTIALVNSLTQSRALPEQVLAEINAKTDGVPLFVEELTKTILESGFLRETADAYVLDSPLPPLAIPASLQDSLLARLDRLAPVRLVAQIGAAIGREFSFKLLTAVAALGDEVIEQGLNQLVGSELAFRRGHPPDATYTFKHALVQDVAYQSLLKSKRQQLHRRIATVLEREFSGIANAEPEVLAHHYTQAGMSERAVGHWTRAGAVAISRSANLEAISHLNRGLGCLSLLPEGRERDQKEVTIQNALGGPLIAIHGYAAAEVSKAFGQARVLCERLGATEPLCAALSGEYVYHFVRGDYHTMQELSEECERLSERLPNSGLQLASHRLRAMTAMYQGELLHARCEFEHILSVYDPSKHRLQPVHYVHDPKVSALTYLAPILWILGFPEQAERSSAAAFEFANELNQVNLTVHVRAFAGAGLYELLRDLAAVREHAAAIVDLSRKHSLRYWLQNGLILQGWVSAQEASSSEGCALMKQGIAERAALAVGWYQIRYLCMLAECHLQRGQLETGLQVIAEAKEMMAQIKDRMWEAEVYRLEGELFRETASPGAAESALQGALTLARRQSTKSFELRAAMSLARCWRERGKRPEAQQLLAEVYNRFTEGFDTADLREANALLNAMA